MAVARYSSLFFFECDVVCQLYEYYKYYFSIKNDQLLPWFRRKVFELTVYQNLSL